MPRASNLDMDRIERINSQKRTVDLVVCLLLLPITLPLAVILAVILRIRQGGGVLFSQDRLGYQSRVFKVYKFRTMLNNRDESGRLLPDAQRLTAIGRFMRKTSLDEIPQLFNVLKGDMSFVGPRPLFARYKPFYTDREATRHLVRPGITGLAQSDGRNFLRWDQRLEKDAQYVERLSLTRDLKIMCKTLRAVITRKDIKVIPGLTGAPLDVYRTYPMDADFALRPLEWEDLPLRVEWLGQSETRRYMGFGPEKITLVSTQNWFNQNKAEPGKLNFVIYDRHNHEIVAMTGLRDRMPGVAESYTMVTEDRRGEGIGTRSMKLTREWAFFHAGYVTVISSVRTDNVASTRMIEKFPGTKVEVSEDRWELTLTKSEFEQTYKPATADE